MIDNYSPATIGPADLEAILARVARYVARHGSEYGENPCGDPEEARQQIIFEWQAADWTALELTYLARNGRTIFGPELSDMGRHLRAVLFTAGRARRRRWTIQAADRRAGRAEARRRDFDDSTGAGMASRAADPARIAEAVEAVQQSGFRTTPDRFKRRRLRWVKTRNSTGATINVIRRLPDRTDIEVVPFTRYNFRRAGDVTNRAMPKTRTALPAGWSVDMLREAIG